MFQPRISFLITMVVYTVAMRLLPYVLQRFGMDIDPATTVYPWNFSPLMAICLYGGAHFANRAWSYLVPLGSLFLSDIGIAILNPGFGFYRGQVFTYACFALAISLGMLLRKRRSVPAIAGAGLAAETVFFVVTNFAVWMINDGRYPHTLNGLLLCYWMALPFFGRSLLSTGIFSAVLFSRLAVVPRSAETLVPQAVPATASR